MNAKSLSALLSLLLVASGSFLGYASMSSWASPTPTPGQIGITSAYLFNLSDNVRIKFMSGVDWYGAKLIIDHEYAQVNYGTQIGVQSSIGCDLNLTSWNTVPENTAGTVADFTIWSATGWSAFTFYIGNLHQGLWYNVYIDGSLGPSKLVGTPITWDYAGAAGTHTFQVRQIAFDSSTAGIITFIFMTLYLGVAIAPAMWIVKLIKNKRKNSNIQTDVHEVIYLAVYILLGLTLITVTWGLVGS